MGQRRIRAWTGSPDNPSAASAINAMARTTEIEGRVCVDLIAPGAPT
jgi:hypothetical protein